MSTKKRINEFEKLVEQERQKAEQERIKAELTKIESIRLLLEMGVPLEKVCERLGVDEEFLKRNNLI